MNTSYLEHKIKGTTLMPKCNDLYILLGTVNSFIDWRNKQKTAKRGGKTMYDVKGHYQYLHENEMFDYWNKHVNCV